MKIISRNIVGGYYLLEKPILRGIEYVHCYNCGAVGDKSLFYIQFSPDLYLDTLGKHQESFDLSGIGADDIAAELFALIAQEPPDLSRFAPSAIERITASMLEGMDMFEACMTHVARLLPEYCGATFAECIEFRPELLVISKSIDPETGIETEYQNITRCSLEGC